MQGRKLSQQVVWVIVIALLLVGCGAPAATQTPITPTPKPASVTFPEYDPNTILVTFTGDECTSSGPTELPVGEHLFVFRNLTENFQSLYLLSFLDDHIYQELLDMQSEPGVYYPMPSWAVHPNPIFIQWNEPSDLVYTFYLDEEGEYGIDIGAENPPSLWFCGSFQVIEAPSE